MRAIAILAGLSLALSACSVSTFDDGLGSSPADDRDIIMMSASYETVRDRLVAHASASGIGQIDPAKPMEVSEQAYSNGRVTTFGIYIQPTRNKKDYSAFFRCPNGKKIYMAAGTVLISEKRSETKVSYLVSITGTTDPVDVTQCPISPGFLRQLAIDAGITVS